MIIILASLLTVFVQHSAWPDGFFWVDHGGNRTERQIIAIMNGCPGLRDLANARGTEFDSMAAQVEHQMRLLQRFSTKDLYLTQKFLEGRKDKHSEEGRSYRADISRQHPEWPDWKIDEAPFFEPAATGFGAVFWMRRFLFVASARDDNILDPGAIYKNGKGVQGEVTPGCLTIYGRSRSMRAASHMSIISAFRITSGTEAWPPRSRG